MKVLSGSIAVNKTGVTGVSMEPFIEFQSEDNAKISAPCKPPSSQEDRLTQPIENGSRWNILRRLRKSLTRPESDCGAQLFGQPLCKISPDDCSLPKPVTVSRPAATPIDSGTNENQPCDLQTVAINEQQVQL